MSRMKPVLSDKEWLAVVKEITPHSVAYRYNVYKIVLGYLCWTAGLYYTKGKVQTIRDEHKEKTELINELREEWYHEKKLQEEEARRHPPKATSEKAAVLGDVESWINLVEDDADDNLVLSETE